MGRFENFTPIIEVEEITNAEETMLEELVALANSSGGQFIRKVGGSLVNATLSETMALSGLSDVTLTSTTQGDILYYNGTEWVNLPAGTSGQLLRTQGNNANPVWVTAGGGTVTSVSVVTANGVSGSVATSTTTPAITLTLGAITPSSIVVDDITINGNTISSAGASSLAITPTAGQAILLDATISIDAGVVTGATSITSTAFVGDLTGTASGNLTSGGALGTPSSGTLTNCTGLPVAGIAASTVTALGVGSIELGHATDTTIARSGAGAITVEGVAVLLSGGALGTPSSGTGTNIAGIPAANILAGSFGAGAYVISTSLQVVTIELGHATDTTISRVSAGVIAVEGVNVVLTTVTALSSLGTVSTGLTGVLRADAGVLAVDSDVTDIVSAASLTLAGKVELATAAEVDTGTDTTRAIPIDQFVASVRNVRYFLYRVVEATTDTAVATTKGGDLEIPITGTITEIGAYVDTAGTTGTMTIDVNKNGTTLMTTNKITIDTAEKSSRTAATAPVLTTTAIAAGDLITIDIDAIHTTAAKGLTVRLGIRLS